MPIACPVEGQGYPHRAIVRLREAGEDVPMAFAEGQQVLVKTGQAVGVVARKLAHFQDMYVVQLNQNSTPRKKLAHESDLELLAEERLGA
jgi:hypothetical protein